MMRTKYISGILLSVSGLALVACGGSSSSTPPPVTTAPPPSGTSGTVVGPIDGFGSVIVNGERYDTSNASFTIDRKAGSEADLKVGQIVTLKTETDANGNKSASEVSFKDAVQGPIEAIDVDRNRMTVLGQTVIIRAATSFDSDIEPGSLEGLAEGDFVEVSGQINGGGNIVASQISLSDETSSFELTGHVSALNPGQSTFKIRGQDIDFTDAVLEEFGEETLANGNRVEVVGSGLSAEGVFVAETVYFETKNKKGNGRGNSNGNGGNPDDDGEVKGLITDFTSSAEFVVGDTPVITTEATEFENCLASDLALDVEVEVEGEFNDDNVLVADEVECEIEADLQIESTLDSVDVDAGTLTVFGVTFATDMSTRFQDKTDTPVTSFGLDDLAEGDYVLVRGFERSDMTLYAKKVERDDPEDEDTVKGYVDISDDSSLMILGIDITTDEETEYEIDDEEVDAETFFGQLTSEVYVKAEGERTGDQSMLADKLEIENEDDDEDDD